MAEFNTLTVKLSNSQFNKLKSGIKNDTEVTLNLSSNMIGNCNDKNSFPHKLFLTDIQVSRLCKVFANDSSAKIKFLKTRLFKLIQPRGIIAVLIGVIPQLMFH